MCGLTMFLHANSGGWCNGNTLGFGPRTRGSTPCPPAKRAQFNLFGMCSFGLRSVRVNLLGFLPFHMQCEKGSERIERSSLPNKHTVQLPHKHAKI